MSTRHKYTQVYKKVFLFLLLLSVPCFLLLHRPEKTARDAAGLPPGPGKNPPLSETPRFVETEGLPRLSTQETRLLEQLKAEIAAYHTKIKSGEIEFSVTVSRIPPPETKNLFVELFEGVRDSFREEKNANALPTSEETGHWHIIYRFNGETEFFDVKAHLKRDINGGVIVTRTEKGGLRHDIWREAHYQFLRHRKQTLYILEGTKWRLYDEWQQSLPVWIPTDVFDKCFNPHWWHLGHDEPLDTFIDRHKITEVKRVENNGSPHIYLQLYHTEVEDMNLPVSRATTHEIWMHPKASIYPKRILIANRRAQFQPELEILETIGFQNLTSEIAEYEPGIFFPKTVTEEYYGENSMSEIFPDRPNSEYPLIMHEALLPESFRKEYQKAPRLKRVMKVHRVVFNIPMVLNLKSYE